MSKEQVKLKHIAEKANISIDVILNGKLIIVRL